MQNTTECPMISDDKEEIIEMAKKIGMKPDTLYETIQMLSKEGDIKCPSSVLPPSSWPVVPEPVVPERPGTTLPLSSKSILGTRAASGMYGQKRLRENMIGGMDLSSFVEPGENAATSLTRLVKISILAIPTYLIIGGYLMNSIGYQTLSAGINAVFSGECTYLTSRIYSAFGLGNPVCDSYNSIMATIYRALNFNGVDIAIIGSSLTVILAIPALFESFVAIITSVIAHSLKRAQTVDIDDRTLAALKTNASSAWTNWTTLTINSQVSNLIPSRVALVAGISQEAQAQAEVQAEAQASEAPGAKKARKGGAKRKTRKSKRNSRKSKVRKTKRLNKKISRKTKHGRRKKARKTKKNN